MLQAMTVCGICIVALRTNNLVDYTSGAGITLAVANNIMFEVLMS